MCCAHETMCHGKNVRMAHATLGLGFIPLDVAENRKQTSGIKQALHEPEAALCIYNNKGRLGEFARDPMDAENRGDLRF